VTRHEENIVMKRILIAALLLAGAPQPLLADDLLQLYQRAQQNDPQIRAARASRLAAGEAEPIARAGLLPNLSARGSFDYADQNLDGGIDDEYERRLVEVAVTQPLYRRDRWVRLEQAGKQIAQAEADLEAAEQGLRLRVAQAYFGVLAAQDTLTFSEAEQEAIARQLDQAKRRFEVGLIAITGVHEAQARYDAARANVITARNQLDNAREVLREIVGGELGELLKLKDPVPVLTMPKPADLEHWSNVALDNNPGVLAARYALEVAQQEVEAQRSGHYPTLDLVGGYSVVNSGAILATDATTASVGVELAVPLYAGGGVSAATQQARYNQQAARESLEQQRRAVSRQVRDAYRGMEASISRVEALKAGTVSAASALEATQAGFEVGTRTLVDVLNAQSELFRSQRDYAQARYDYVLNLLNLKQAAGIVGADDLAEVNAWLE
jgi:outer membrane protein